MTFAGEVPKKCCVKNATSAFREFKTQFAAIRGNVQKIGAANNKPIPTGSREFAEGSAKCPSRLRGHSRNRARQGIGLVFIRRALKLSR